MWYLNIQTNEIINMDKVIHISISHSTSNPSFAEVTAETDDGYYQLFKCCERTDEMDFMEGSYLDKCKLFLQGFHGYIHAKGNNESEVFTNKSIVTTIKTTHEVVQSLLTVLNPILTNIVTAWEEIITLTNTIVDKIKE